MRIAVTTFAAVNECLPAETKSPAVARTADHTGCQWPSGSSKVNDFHFTWKGVYATFY